MTRLVQPGDMAKECVYCGHSGNAHETGAITDQLGCYRQYPERCGCTRWEPETDWAEGHLQFTDESGTWCREDCPMPDEICGRLAIIQNDPA